MATATPTAVKKLTIPMPLSLSAALDCVGDSKREPDVLVGPEVEEGVMAEDSNELSMEPVIDAVPVAESVPVSVPVPVADAEASVSVEDMLWKLCR
jgi:hypothetical protein